MRIEVIIGNDDPVVYPLNAPKITLGTSENCDIILNAEGISRKHVVILTEGDNFYVIDQGSTNGSYINEERLIPGKKTEFTSFFPLRLGDRVLITLLSDEEVYETSSPKIEVPESFVEKKESSPESKEDALQRTRVIQLSELTSSKTKNLIQKRNEKRIAAQRKTSAAPAKKVKKEPRNLVPYVAISLLVGAGAYTYHMNRPEEIPQPTPVVKKTEQAAPVEQPVQEKSYLIPENELVGVEKYQNILEDLKCTTDTESTLCDYFPGARDSRFGVIQIGLTIHILVDGTKYFEAAKEYVFSPGKTEEALNYYNHLIGETAAYLYLLDVIENQYTTTEVVETLSTPEAAPAVAETTPDALPDFPEIPVVGDDQEATAETPPPPAVEETPQIQPQQVTRIVKVEKPPLDISPYKDFNFQIALMRPSEDGSFQVGRVIAIKPEVVPMLKDFIKANDLQNIRTNGENALTSAKNKYRTL